MTRKALSFFRMDEQVVYTMAGICIVSLVTLAFRFISDKSCEPVNISFSSDSIYVDEIVRLSTDIKAGKHFSWYFGDGTFEENAGSTVNHKYKDARNYTVKVVVDGECTDIQTVSVYERKLIIVPSAEPVINYPQSAFVNETVTFSDVSSSSTSWEWYFDESPDVYSREQSVSRSFSTPGSKKIVLKVNKKSDLPVVRFITILPRAEDPLNGRANGGGMPGKKRNLPTIIINDKPESEPINTQENKVQPVPEQPKVEEPKQRTGADITDDQLQDALYKVSEGKKSAADFADYLCGNMDIKVNYDHKVYSFKEFCAELQKIKAKKIKTISVSTTKNKSNCIVGMQVSIRKKLISF
jgi:hypothetical protein